MGKLMIIGITVSVLAWTGSQEEFFCTSNSHRQ